MRYITKKTRNKDGGDDDDSSSDEKLDKKNTQ